MMLKRNKELIILLVVVFAGVLYGCSKKWDDHNALTGGAPRNNLAEAIGSTPGLDKFSELLVKSGYDKIVSSSKTFTVWAPTDSALQSLDASIMNDSVKLAQFVGNHISYQSYLAGAARQRIRMLNGKYMVFSGSSFDSARIVTANQHAGNGIFHVIDKFIPRTGNIWELISSTTEAHAQKNFLLSLNRNVFDASAATQVSVDPLTGEPVYDTASGIKVRNSFLDSVMNVADEAKEYTMFLLTDAAYQTEFNKLSPWFKTGSAESTNRLTGLWLVKDLVFKGDYSLSSLPDTLVSESGVKVPVNKPAIVASYKASNGTIYVMNEMNFNLSYKFPTIYIQGENPLSFAASRTSQTTYRARFNPVTGQNFTDIYMKDYGYASYWIRYLARNLNSMRYNAYWVAVNDVQTSPLYSQRLAVDSVSNTATFPYKQIQYKNYNEEFIGQFTVNNFRSVPLFVVGPASSSTSSGNNSITLDYIKLVPAF